MRALSRMFTLVVVLLFCLTYSTGQEFECPGPGVWADPENCQCYYNCANHVAYPTCCGEGTLWDDVFHDCDYVDNVDCGDRPLPGSTRPSTVEPTSTTPTTPATTVSTTVTTPGTTTSPIVTETTAGGPTTTTSHVGPTGPQPGLPSKVMGMYILLADDTEDGYHSDDSDWEPLLYPYQQAGANVLFFTFINPATMEVPVSFGKLAASRGQNTEGAVPADTLIIFAIGGYAYSLNPNPWEWLTSQQKAEEMAEKVAGWGDQFGVEGIDLDLEEGAGSNPVAGPNMVHFVRRLKSLQPGWLVTQPTYGFPQIQAEIDVINASFNPGGATNNLADTVGLMVYEGTQALQYVKNYAEGSSQWEGFPIHVDVPSNRILAGCKGSSSSGTITTLAQESVKQDLLGVMVWFCSVQNGLVYGHGWDCSDSQDSMDGYVAAMDYFNSHM